MGTWSLGQFVIDESEFSGGNTVDMCALKAVTNELVGRKLGRLLLSVDRASVYKETSPSHSGPISERGVL